MTPLELLALIAVFAVVRIAITVRREPSAGVGTDRDLNGAAAAEQSHRWPSLRTVVREYLDAFIVAGLVALFLITFVVRTFFIPSGSMEPTLQIHDVLLANEFEYRFAPPHEGDIVVFPPPVPTSNDYIKRAIGLPGDQLRVHQGVVYRNGVAMNEPYINEKPNYELEVRDYGIYVDGTPLDPALSNIPPRKQWIAPDRIPPGYYVMFGDNRTLSADSHIWGFAQAGGTFQSGQRKGEKAGLTGHAFVLIWPFNRIRILR